jgi:hypothetical protein
VEDWIALAGDAEELHVVSPTLLLGWLEPSLLQAKLNFII